MTELHIRDWKQDGHRKRQVSDPRVPRGNLGCLVHIDRILLSEESKLIVRSQRGGGEAEALVSS